MAVQLHAVFILSRNDRSSIMWKCWSGHVTNVLVSRAGTKKLVLLLSLCVDTTRTPTSHPPVGGLRLLGERQPAATRPRSSRQP